MRAGLQWMQNISEPELCHSNGEGGGVLERVSGEEDIMGHHMMVFPSLPAPCQPTYAFVMLSSKISCDH
jgi:hypothetical protein